ncbi:pyridoxamine 5'-phosphate oxidase [Microbacterium gorillae]|uniref:pyridoxamine 5'-phosphate oxidase n=1 Tax=Microbacterium gorillae TaxID=1231063 RepID=UPI000590A6D0|nr:pyridoxamine 5'-phosphate oxidase [Microbacterium gorillae]
MIDPDSIARLRTEYGLAGLDVDDLAGDPLTMFRRWLDEAIAAGLHEPNAMVLSTADADGVPNSRIVLLKGLDTGFVLFTSTASAKGRELAANPRCALLFPWYPLERQVRVAGTASALTPAEVQAYFDTRPRGSQLGAWASAQSTPVPDREALERSYAEVESRFADAVVPVPPYWGGYRIEPTSVEFWQGRPARMHDRLRYERDGDTWKVVRLAP